MSKRAARIACRPLLQHERGGIGRHRLAKLLDLLTFGCHLRRHLNELRQQPLALVERQLLGRHQQQILDIRRDIARLAAAGIGGGPDAEPAQRAGIVPLEEQLHGEHVQLFQRPLELKHGIVRTALPAVHRPAGLRVVVDRGGGGVVAAGEGVGGGFE
jgi:hypothetical protein